MDEHKQTIDAWLEEDKKSLYKQKHAAKRVYDRLVDECGYTGIYIRQQDARAYFAKRLA